MLTFFAFIIVLGVIILVHELGHFLVAKSFGVRVLTFSFGFGPKVLRIERGETEYAISLLPLGGYVKMLGEDPEEEVPPEEKGRSFGGRPLWQRTLIVAAGPFSNLLFSVLLFFVLFSTGVPKLLPVVGGTVEGFPAKDAGLREGDRILSIDGKDIKYWEDLLKVIPESKGKPLTICLDRQGRKIQVELRPKVVRHKNIFGEEVEVYQIGILPKGELVWVRYPVGESFLLGVKQTWYVSELVVTSMWKILKGSLSAKSVGGPILIAQMAGQEAKKGIGQFLSFIALISINIGLLNLFPIPILDGGHMALFGLQALIRRPLDRRKLEAIQKVGLGIIIALMGLAFYNDMIRLIGPQK